MATIPCQIRLRTNCNKRPARSSIYGGMFILRRILHCFCVDSSHSMACILLVLQMTTVLCELWASDFSRSGTVNCNLFLHNLMGLTNNTALIKCPAVYSFVTKDATCSQTLKSNQHPNGHHKESCFTKMMFMLLGPPIHPTGTCMQPPFGRWARFAESTFQADATEKSKPESLKVCQGFAQESIKRSQCGKQKAPT
eukprot:scaffold329_cov390-Pavlova_lutheri.AAC.9